MLQAARFGLARGNLRRTYPFDRLARLSVGGGIYPAGNPSALLTGTRWGELTSLKGADVNLSTAHLYIAESKSGRSRHVPLNPEGLKHFKDLVTGKAGDELVLADLQP